MSYSYDYPHPAVTTDRSASGATSARPRAVRHPDQAEWSAIPPWNTSAGTAGVHRSASFSPAVRFTVPDDWTRPPGFGELPTMLSPLAPPGARPSEAVHLIRHKDDPSVDTWLARMRDHDNVAVVGVEPASIGGVEAIEVRFEILGPVIYALPADGVVVRLQAGQAGTARATEIDGQVVSLLVLAAGPDRVPALESAAAPVVDSLRWRSVEAGP